ncbi:MAG: hypothetical protein HQM13_19675 [SAR324 cluster bacterium]|nr:hypothetical protein [SAR324 cluster bacterium]
MPSTFIQHRLIENDELNDKEQKWLASAIAGAVISDRHVTSSQMSWLHEAVSFLDQNDADTLISQMKTGSIPVLEKLSIKDRDKAARIFLDLVMIIMENMSISKSEAHFITEAAKKLGIQEHRAHKILTWAHDLLHRFKMRDSFVKFIAEDDVIYQ